MPKVFLKPNSPEYADEHTAKRNDACEMPGCPHIGAHKAPKTRGLNDYYMFCGEHIKEYNRAWNFFEGMQDAEVMDHMQKEYYGHRPTWKYGVDGNPEDLLKEKAQQFYSGAERPNQQHNAHNGQQTHHHIDPSSQEFQALAIMGLKPPLRLDEIKSHYKALVKKHHPDLNHGCKKSEDLLKRINMAYTILKVAYENFEKLPER